MVLQELDRLKHKNKNTTADLAKRAIHFIYVNLKREHPRFVGQSALEDCRHLIEIESPDDKILNCCLQLKSSSKKVILLSDDKNLCCKAKSSGIDIRTSRMCNEKYDRDE